MATYFYDLSLSLTVVGCAIDIALGDVAPQ